MELMYKPGDKVMIRPDLNCREIYYMRSGRHNGDCATMWLIKW